MDDNAPGDDGDGGDDDGDKRQISSIEMIMFDNGFLIDFF